MDCTGIVNIQCDHIFIKATIDLQLGERYDISPEFQDQSDVFERFANTDYALAHAIKQVRSSENPDDTNRYLTSITSQFPTMSCVATLSMPWIGLLNTFLNWSRGLRRCAGSSQLSMFKTTKTIVCISSPQCTSLVLATSTEKPLK